MWGFVWSYFGSRISGFESRVPGSGLRLWEFLQPASFNAARSGLADAGRFSTELVRAGVYPGDLYGAISDFGFRVSSSGLRLWEFL